MLFRKFSSTIGQEAVFWRCACKGTSRALWAVAVTPLQQYYFVRTYCCCERHASTSYKQVFMCSKTHSKVLLLDGGFFRDVPVVPVANATFSRRRGIARFPRRVPGCSGKRTRVPGQHTKLLATAISPGQQFDLPAARHVCQI